MKIRLPNTARLHDLRMANDARRYEMQEQAPRFQSLAARHEEGTAPRAVIAHQLFQTPPEFAAQLAALLDIQPGARILEPSAGLGRILDALAPYSPAEIVAIESAPACARELFTQDRPGVTIKQRDFMTTLPEEIGYFDAVAMNPPFTMRSDVRHIRHALDFLKPGGRLACLMMDTPHRAAAFQHDAEEWIKVPAGTFRSEGTDVPTILALLKFQ